MIDRAMVRHLADAARIDLAVEEVDRIADQLTDILDELGVVRALGEADGAATVDTVRSDTMHEVEPPMQPLRADVPGADALIGTAARFAPEVRDGFFTVPLLPSHGGDPA